MDRQEKKGWFNLSKRSLSVMAASVAVLVGNQINAKPIIETTVFEGDASETAVKKLLKPKLVLKLNMSNPSRSLVSMHTSHASHSSHASHASHASSSPSYTPTYSPEPVRTTPVYTPTKSEPVTYSVPADTVTKRALHMGLKGEDVRQMQQLLKNKGYNVPVSGYFGRQTEIAVKKFQIQNDLPADGKVGNLTLSMLAY
jgi:His-Xaa-Ser repeat protein HxsA